MRSDGFYLGSGDSIGICNTAICGNCRNATIPPARGRPNGVLFLCIKTACIKFRICWGRIPVKELLSHLEDQLLLFFGRKGRWWDPFFWFPTDDSRLG